MLDALRAIAARTGRRVWLVGGTVRDRELGRPSPDLDVMVEDDARGLAAEVAAELGRPWFTLSPDFGAYRVTGLEGYLDVVRMQGGSLEADLSLRDFTVNAMAVPLEGGSVVDPFGGWAHVRDRLLVAVGPDVFRNDPLRLLRGARLAHTLGFSLEATTEEQLRTDADLVWEAAGERIQSEVVLTLEEGRSPAAVRLWERIGVLDHLFPEIGALRGVGQSGNHHLDVFGHTLETLESMDLLLADPEGWFPDGGVALERRLGAPVDGAVSRPVALRLAALFHDCAKPGVKELDGEGNVLFWGHSREGGRVVEEVCGRMRCSRRLASVVRRTTERHLDLGFLQRSETLSRRHLIQYLWDAAPWEPETVLVSVADRQATRGPAAKQEYVNGHLELARRLLAEWARREVEGISPLPLDGHYLRRELGLEGPALGAVLRELTLAWQAGEVKEMPEIMELAAHLRRGEEEGGKGW